jgi:hypothetical protein
MVGFLRAKIPCNIGVSVADPADGKELHAFIGEYGAAKVP